MPARTAKRTSKRNHGFVSQHQLGSELNPVDLTIDENTTIATLGSKVPSSDPAYFISTDPSIKTSLAPHGGAPLGTGSTTTALELTGGGNGLATPRVTRNSTRNLNSRLQLQELSGKFLTLRTPEVLDRESDTYEVQTYPGFSSEAIDTGATPKVLCSTSALATPIQSKGVNFTKLPTELVLKIFGYLSPVSFTVLSLTCKRFLTINREINTAKVPITKKSDGIMLYRLLKEWMGPELIFAAPFKKYISTAMWRRMLQERCVTKKLLDANKAKHKAVIERRKARDEKKKADEKGAFEEMEKIKGILRRIKLRNKLSRARNPSKGATGSKN